MRLDVDNLRRTLSRKFGVSGTVPDIIECSAAVMRNVRPFQHSARSVRTNQRPRLGPSANQSAVLFRNDTIMTKWTVSVDRRVYPPHCTGWMYVTTPR